MVKHLNSVIFIQINVMDSHLESKKKSDMYICRFIASCFWEAEMILLYIFIITNNILSYKINLQL